MKQKEAYPAREGQPQILFGIGASPGIEIGNVLHVDRHIQRSKHIYLGEDRVDREIERFRSAVATVEAQLDKARSQFADQLDTHLSIIDTHKLMLRDRMLYDHTLSLIQNEAINTEWGLERSLEKIAKLFEAIEDSYLRDRFQDIEQVVQRLLLALSGDHGEFNMEIGEQNIAVARDFSPEDTLRMRSQRVRGFVTETGGTTSHTAIIARTLGIPSVVGVAGISELVESGDTIIIDGANGRVLLNPTEDQRRHYEDLRQQQQRYSERIQAYVPLKPETVEGLQVEVLANVDIAEEAQSVLEFGATGIGLFRSEYYYISKRHIPDEEALFELYRSILNGLAPYPATIRTLDMGGDKMPSTVCFPHETNPAMGLRAIRFCLRETQIFKTQLRAMLRASVHGNLRIMFPMISSLCELERVKEALEEVKGELRVEGAAFNEQVKIGIMIEVPSAVSIADVLAREVDFFSIGTNDLIQYALAIDRVNEYVAHMYEPLSPAVLRMIKQVTDAGHGAGIDVGMCGEMAGEGIYLPLLLGLGLDELSMHPFAIPTIKKMVRDSSMKSVEEIGRAALRCSSTKEVRDLLANYLAAEYPDDVDVNRIYQRGNPC